MKRALLMLTAVVVLAGVPGCCCPSAQGLTSLIFGSCDAAPENCAGCDGCADPSCGDCGDCCDCGDPRCRRGRETFTPGPPTGAITYPYYTTRGPRDYFAQDPRSIGP